MDGAPHSIHFTLTLEVFIFCVYYYRYRYKLMHGPISKAKIPELKEASTRRDVRSMFGRFKEIATKQQYMGAILATGEQQFFTLM